MIDTIKDQLKKAMIAKDKNRVDSLRNILSKLKTEEINKKRPLSDEESLNVLQSMAKQLKESIKQFADGNRHDLVAKEEAELNILIKFLPEPIAIDELKKIINDVIDKTGAVEMKDMGKVMGAVIKMTNGRADGQVISNIVREKLS